MCYFMIIFFFILFYTVRSSVKTCEVLVLFLLGLTEDLSVYISAVLSGICCSDFFSQGVGALWLLEQCEES